MGAMQGSDQGMARQLIQTALQGIQQHGHQLGEDSKALCQDVPWNNRGEQNGILDHCWKMVISQLG